MELDTLDKRHIAHQLLIELLAHQFAYPVRWIDTQNALFRNPRDISRFVELGPAKVLAGMAKRTRDSKYARKDRAKCLKRHFLSCTQSPKEIHYEYEARAENPAEAATAPPPSHATTETMRLESQVPTEFAAQALNVAATSIADVPTPAGEILRALIACKLKRNIDHVLPARTIKDLSGGKSTLQNEIIGDLGVEFGTTPDGAEDLAISSLGESLGTQHNGQLGKISSAMIARFISASMPAKFNLASAREHLSNRWGLGPSRQTSVLLFAMAETTASGACRLPSALAAQELLDSSCTRYAASCGLALQARSTSSAVSETQNPVVDAAIMKRLSTEHRLLASKQLQALSGYLEVDADARKDYDMLESAQQDLQKQLDLWISEFGDEFQTGIKPVFDSRKSRWYNSSWNQARLEIMSAYYASMNPSSPAQSNPPNFPDSKLVSVANKASKLTLRTLERLRDEDVSDAPPSISFIQLADKLIPMINASIACGPRAVFAMSLTGPRTTIGSDGAVEYQEIPRLGSSGASYTDLIRGGFNKDNGVGVGDEKAAVLTRHGSRWEEAQSLSETMFTAIQDALDNGISLSGKHILVTGAGPGSIGGEVVKILLQSGAHVIMTTSREPAAASGPAQSLYAEHAGRDSELVVLPFNQASATDCKSLVDYLYNTSGLGINLDAVIPFAALSETGIEVDTIDSRSELAHRLMLTNIFRLVGHIIRKKTEHDILCRPTQVILPFSPNHGIFGGDGLYSESKLGLESLLNRFHSESWADLVSITGVVIGWTRGTGLMRQNDLVAETIEKHGVLTFSQQEMALNVVSLLTFPIVQICEDQPIVADFSGGLGRLENCKEVFAQAHMDISTESALRKAIHNEDRLETQQPNEWKTSSSIRHRSTLRMGFPPLPNHAKDLLPLSHLQDMVDLSSTVVVVGFSELGPWGNARTRWERESQGNLSQAGYLELAWLMNLIKHFDGNDSAGYYVGWVDSKTCERIHDDEIEAKYGQYILQNSGIRLIDPDLFNGYDPSKKEFLQEIAVEEDLPEFDADPATAEAFKRRHGDGVVIRHKLGEQCRVQVKSGARILVPKASIFEAGLVAGQLPKGWDAAKYGIEEDIIKQVDPVTIYVLCCVAEALLSAGIADPMEIYEHIHVSELGNFIGSSMGGTEKTRQMYRDIHLDKQVQGDVIQETYINTPSAWVNMLLLGASGPIKTPVGACATGVEAIDIGFESIISGKTQMCVVGGTDNFQEDESYGFSTIKATANATEELLKGRLPHEMSRPTAESRAGFVESQGCGIQILCSAELAIAMGLPIYAIIAGSTMAADKISRSVPAPGSGVLTFARETAETVASPLLDIRYRRDQLQRTIAQLECSNDAALDGLSTPGFMTPPFSDIEDATCIVLKQSSGGPQGQTALVSQIKAAQRLWGNEFRRQDPQISPLRASLAVWGLTVNDVSVASLHATSTKANDKNEPSIINTQMTHLGRQGPPMLAVCQKSITGHPKAPAASWMLNGCLQMLATGIIPGNQNADNVDPILEQFDHLVFPTKTIKVHEVKAFMLTSFGFGQKGGQIVGVAPKYLFATLGRQQYEEYAAQVSKRTQKADRSFAQAVMSNTIFRARDKPPYTAANEAKILLDPLARVSKNAGSDEYQFRDRAGPPSQPQPMLSRRTTVGTNSSDGTLTPTTPVQHQPLTPDLVSKAWIEQVVSAHPAEKISVGIDVEYIDQFTHDENAVFVDRNYTRAEQRFARQSRDPHATFVSRWCAKEAVFKSLGVKSKGAGADLVDIEIEACDGIPRVKLHGDAALVAAEQGIQDIQLSLTYSNSNVVALALAMR